MTTLRRTRRRSMLRVQIDDEGEPVKDMSSVFDPEDTPRAGKTDLTNWA